MCSHTNLTTINIYNDTDITRPNLPLIGLDLDVMSDDWLKVVSNITVSQSEAELGGSLSSLS